VRYGTSSAFGNWKIKKVRRFVNTIASCMASADETVFSLYTINKGAEHSSPLLQVKNDG
jgi:hypothetical protein